jgi:hypothetical protein
VLLPSRSQRRLLLAAAAANSVLSAALLASFCAAALRSGFAASWTALAGACACLIAAAIVLVRLYAPASSRPQEHVLHDARITHADAQRIVLRSARSRVVVWRDAVAPEVFRRLSVHARWGGIKAPRPVLLIGRD